MNSYPCGTEEHELYHKLDFELMHLYSCGTEEHELYHKLGSEQMNLWSCGTEEHKLYHSPVLKTKLFPQWYKGEG